MGPLLFFFSFFFSFFLSFFFVLFVLLFFLQFFSCSCWVEATLDRLFDFGVTGRLWHLLTNFLCDTLSQVRHGGSVSPPQVNSGIAQGRILSHLLFNLLNDSLAATLRSAIPGVTLAASDSFRHVCQLYADDPVVLTASGPRPCACLGCSLALLLWCRPHQVRHFGLWSSARPP